jgi:hypothetical protein
MIDFSLEITGMFITYDMVLFGIPEVQTKMLRAGHKHGGSSVP